MNPNRLTRELRKLPGNIRSPHFPGGTLISGVLDRRLMGWSDRGGASRIFGELWSEFCWSYLSNGSSPLKELSGSGTDPVVIRLDDNPRVALQAGRNKLPNPDFLILDADPDGNPVVRAVDAKFAVDRLRRSQVSPESIRDLIELPGSVARQVVTEHLESGSLDDVRYAPGMFIGPSNLLNDYFYQHLTGGDEPIIPVDELMLVAVDSQELFTETEVHPLMELLRSVDSVDGGSPESELVVGMYYLRLASAARWFETQSQLPLLSQDAPQEIEVEHIYSVARSRIESGVSAYGLIETWSDSAERAVRRQKRVQDAARLPVRMSEIRRKIERLGFGDDKKLIRKARGVLEQQFARRLGEEIGTIPARPRESMEVVVSRVSSASRGLRQEMLKHAEDIVEMLASYNDEGGE